MTNILKQFLSDQHVKVYDYGEVVSVGFNGIVKIKITSGLELTLRDNNQTYVIGDQVVLGTKDGNLSSVFIIRKIDRICKTAINVIISNDQG